MDSGKTSAIIPLIIIDLHEDGFHPLVEITVFGKSFLVVLDTGASKTAFDHVLMMEVNKGGKIAISDHLSTGLGTNSMASSTAIVHDLHIGNFPISEFEIAVLDLSTINIAYRQLGHPEILGVLGGDILMKYKAVIDYGARTLELKKL